MSDGGTDVYGICNLFTSQFKSVYEDNTSKIEGNIHSNSCVVFMNIVINCCFSKIYFSESEVSKCFKSYD